MTTQWTTRSALVLSSVNFDFSSTDFGGVTLLEPCQATLREKEPMKMLITLFAGIMLIGCAGADHHSTMAALGSAAVFHAESEAKPLSMAARR
jgi:hypothetical protein